jgi:signal transduction histidine kinase
LNDKSLILIVDDEPSARDILEGFLHSEGYDLAARPNGPAALAYLEQVAPDLILLDVMMPGMDGFTLCRKIKADRRWRHIPVIIVTALGSKSDLVRGFEAGADDFLSKPVDDLELKARVRSMLRIKRQYDELQEALQLREDLARMIVHDMRTPLTTILGFSELLLARSNLPAPFPDYVSSISVQARRLESFLNDMLLTAKMEAGQPVLVKRLVDLNELVQVVEQSHAVVARSKQIQLALDLPPTAPKIVVDKSLFHRVLDNLIANAAKYSPANSAITVRVRYPAQAVAGQPQAIVQVVDEGPGISPADRERIFDKFEIVVMKHKGASQVGLGLAFCKTVVEAHNGRIYVTANQPVGSIFTVEI